MPGAVAVVVTTAEPACRDAARVLFAGAEYHVFSRDELRPPTPFEGPLFELLALQPSASCLGLCVPVTWRAAASTDPAARPACSGAADLVAVGDHVNFELCGPLGGRWAPGRPRAFPPLAGIYQPSLIRAHGGARVYSSDIVVAGVAEAGRLTPFEARGVEEERLLAVSDVLVPPVIVASYYGLMLAACGVLQADDRDNK
jgi:hypothetical protein